MEIEGTTVLQVCRFTTGQITRFVQGWYLTAERHGTEADGEEVARRARSGADDLLKRLDSTPALNDLAANPHLLTMIANVHRYRGALPGSRVELYEEICQVMLWRRQEAKKLPIQLPGEKKEMLLRRLAYTMMQRRVRDLPLADVCAEIRPALRRLPGQVTLGDFLADVVSNGLLLERESELYCFAHLTFQEYLAAAYIRDRGLVRALKHSIGDPWWRETTLLYTARADADPIVEECLRLETVPALALAHECAAQGSEMDVHLRDRLEQTLTPSPDYVKRDPDRGRLIAGVLLARHLNDQIRTSDGARLCIQPITAALFRLFQEARQFGQSMEQRPYTDGTGPAFVMHAGEVTAFVRWVNWVVGCEPAYRLPSPEVMDDPDVQRLALPSPAGEPLRSVWVMGDGQESAKLWVPPGAPDPHAISDTAVAACIRSDIADHALSVLFRLLLMRSAVLVYSLLTSLRDNRTAHRWRGMRPDLGRPGVLLPEPALADELSQHLHLARQLAGNPGSDIDYARRQALAIARALSGDLDYAFRIASRLSANLARILSSSFGLDYQLALSDDPARLHILIAGDDLGSGCSLIMGQALTQALRVAVSGTASAGDCTDKFTKAFIEASGITETTHFIVTHKLTSMLTATVDNICRAQCPPHKMHALRWTHTVADRLQRTAGPIFEGYAPITSSKATSIRLAALCLAVEADKLDEKRLGDRFRRIAAAITLLQRRSNGDDSPTEMILLAAD